MTEAEWLGKTDPQALLSRLGASGRVHRHKLGLLFAACCDRIPPGTAVGATGPGGAGGDIPGGPIALTGALYHLYRAVSEVMRVIGSGEGERAALVALLRDIFGNPFRPVAFSLDWRTDTAVALARHMYEAQEFGAMPVLADALQDAGCDSDDVLNHCREVGAKHVRGCWVVDLVLAKE